MSDIDRKLKTIFSDVLGMPAGQITDDSSRKNVEAWDSIQHLNLVMEIESAFGVSFTPEEILELQSYHEFREKIAKI